MDNWLNCPGCYSSANEHVFTCEHNERESTVTDINTMYDVFNIFNKYSDRRWLFGPRTRGSTTEACITTLPASRAVKPCTPPDGARVKGAQYFTVYAPELKGRQGAIPLSEVSQEVMPLLRMRITENAICETTGKPIVTQELYIDRDIDGAKAYGMPQQHYMGIIFGPEGDPWTWYPLPFLATLTANGLANNSAKVGDVAVKLHNGKHD